ncbi:hypothetical protein BV22DRAFT_1105892 [Leucogyrophana mollusca]|uniref:Uncharacterized protein n=1 Tax=Leucogyrophana mollusca TaxID=85980 RepID=A0ACB8BEY8_9AGAM|nr:hypothetical protein BV22DRAFT_1105892 [Leucogyrophana mollusca]
MTSTHEFANPEHEFHQLSKKPDITVSVPDWRAGTGSHQYKWMCTACKDNIWRDFRSACRHEDTTSHTRTVRYIQTLAPASEQPSGLVGESSQHVDVTGPLFELLQDISRPPSPIAPVPEHTPPSPEPFDMDWNSLDQEESAFAPSTAQTAVANLTSDLASWLSREPDEGSATGSSDSRAPSILSAPASDTGTSRISQRAVAPEDPGWYPWPDKEVILWALATLGVNNLPSQKVLKDIDQLLQHCCGIETLRYQGALGHVYYVNHLPSLIAQEMANPRIRPHLHHYPEDAGSHLSEAWQASRWLREIDTELATPMVRIGHQDYFVFEPAKLDDGSVMMPERWFSHTSGAGMHEAIDVPTQRLLLSMPHMIETYQLDNLPDPRSIIGIVHAGGRGVSPWTRTDPVKGNRWRALAKGHRVLSFMMWLYCDDTSGNVSKKWNKHNSFLFTAAGLPRVLMQQESNIHFLATSNLAPPLEMLDGIVSQLEDSQTNGIWAWDVDAKEMVLIIPAVLAMLGDNPMQSELACHIGLKGKFFCHNCWVKGQDVDDSNTPAGNRNSPGGRDSDSASAAGSVASHESAVSDDRASLSVAPKGKRRLETMQNLVDRSRRFLGANPPRSRDESIHMLSSMFEDAATIGGKTRYKKAKTESGLKDTFMEHFVDQIFGFAKGLRGSSREKDVLLKKMIADNIPDNYMSPVWRIKGLDPHQDTPVEILHVILLGFVKYFWRDAIARLSDEQKTLLQTRLNSVDVVGLNITRLAGQRFVQFSGSLTGGDFRSISQVAPFVLYGLLPVECYEAWLSLSALVPLVWQPVITDLDDHLRRIDKAIDHFLNCTARWTPRFESFNAVVRDHSVHSNRRAPSRDIGRGMARCNRVRHLLLGGFFMPRTRDNKPQELLEGGPGPTSSARSTPPFSDHGKDWRTAGINPITLTRLRTSVTGKNILTDYFGLAQCVSDKTRARILQKTATFSQLPGALVEPQPRLYQTCQSLTASNGDTCQLYTFVLAKHPDAQLDGQVLPVIGRLSEILQISHSIAQRTNSANFVLLEEFAIAGAASVYDIPLLRTRGWRLVLPNDIICSINVQHNCAANGCTDDGLTTVYEEREATAKKQRRIEHHHIEDLMLNTAQMRDAVHVQRFRIQADDLDREQAILHGAASEIEGRKLKEKQKQGQAAKGKGASRVSQLVSNARRQ